MLVVRTKQAIAKGVWDVKVIDFPSIFSSFMSFPLPVHGSLPFSDEILGQSMVNTVKPRFSQVFFLTLTFSPGNEMVAVHGGHGVKAQTHT
jgi:hypothetical protein